MKQKAAIMTDDNIPKSEIPKVQQAFREFTPKEFDTVPARAAIKQMRRQIERVLRLGYTFEEVSVTLASFDIHISGERIKYLLNDIRKSSRKKSKAKHKTEQDNSSTGEMTALCADSAVIKAADKSTKSTPLKPPEKNNGSTALKIQPQPPKDIAEDSRASPPNSTNNSTDNSALKNQPQPPKGTAEDSRASTPNSTNNSTDNSTENQSAKFKPQLINDEDL